MRRTLTLVPVFSHGEFNVSPIGGTDGTRMGRRWPSGLAPSAQQPFREASPGRRTLHSHPRAQRSNTLITFRWRPDRRPDEGTGPASPPTTTTTTMTTTTTTPTTTTTTDETEDDDDDAVVRHIDSCSAVLYMSIYTTSFGDRVRWFRWINVLLPYMCCYCSDLSISCRHSLITFQTQQYVN